MCFHVAQQVFNATHWVYTAFNSSVKLNKMRCFLRNQKKKPYTERITVMTVLSFCCCCCCWFEYNFVTLRPIITFFHWGLFVFLFFDLFIFCLFGGCLMFISFVLMFLFNSTLHLLGSDNMFRCFVRYIKKWMCDWPRVKHYSSLKIRCCLMKYKNGYRLTNNRITK